MSDVFNIWEGIYDSWGEAKVVGDAFSSEEWINKQASLAEGDIALQSGGQLGNNGCVPAMSWDYILPTVAAMLSNKSRLQILDFGGGLASSYFQAKSGVLRGAEFGYHVVESASVCARGREMFSAYPEVKFYERLPESGSYDVIHCGRSFQYVDDWRQMLSDFVKLNPECIVFAGLLAGNNPSFVTLQNYYGHRVKVRFHNLNIVTKALQDLGYDLIMHLRHSSLRLGKDGPLPMDNFPDRYKLDYPCQLLFRRVPA